MFQFFDVCSKFFDTGTKFFGMCLDSPCGSFRIAMPEPIVSPPDGGQRHEYGGDGAKECQLLDK